MAGKPRKAPNAIAGHRAKPPGGLRALPVPAAETGEPVEIPAFPRGLLKRSREIWVRFWESELAVHVDRSADLYRIERWARDVDELERAWRLYRQSRFTTGSMGQTRLNSVWKVIQDCETRIAKAEEQLGMTPLARARLGLTLGAAATTLDDLNRRMNEPDEVQGPRPVPGRSRPKVPIEGEFSPL